MMLERNDVVKSTRFSSIPFMYCCSNVSSICAYNNNADIVRIRISL